METLKKVPHYYQRCASLLMVIAAVVAVAPFATLEALNKGKTAESCVSICEARAKQKFSVPPGGFGGSDPEDFTFSLFALISAFNWSESVLSFQLVPHNNLSVHEWRSLPLYLLYCVLKLDL